MSSSSPTESSLHRGTWLSLGSPVIAELAAESGFEWLLFDLEHGASTDAHLFGQLQAIKGTQSRAIVRFGEPHPDQVLRALDWGAAGLMVPHVSSAAEARSVVESAYYPPKGKRGYSRSARAYGYGLRVPASAAEIPPPLIMAQIENIEGVENATEIADVEGIDVLFVGPADLQFDLVARPEKATLDFAGCLNAVAAAAKRAGKEAGILLRDVSEVEKYLALGFTWLALDSDLAILRKGYQGLMEKG
ncbi:MAG: HpcH/HpaI aldolase/citrate lyase family protein [Verrucomicrobium sp.]